MTIIQNSELALMAVDTAGTIQDGNYEDALAVLTLLNPLQTVIFYEHLKSYLSPRQLDRFILLADFRMNDEGYFQEVKELGEHLLNHSEILGDK